MSIVKFQDFSDIAEIIGKEIDTHCVKHLDVLLTNHQLKHKFAI